MIAATCTACRREVLLQQLTSAVDGFRCPFCGIALAPSYATIAPRTAARLLTAQAQLVTILGELQAMTGGQLRLHRETLVDPIDERLTATGGDPHATPQPTSTP